MMKTKPIQAVLFDLDGTLLDTASDLVYALNKLRRAHGLPDLTLAEARTKITWGSKEMISHALGVNETHPQFASLRQQFFDIYEQHIADSTQLFPHMDKVLTYLEQQQIPWGVVTNKLTRHTINLLNVLNLIPRSNCIVCGDTLTTYKPHPAPILYACKRLQQDPKHCIYIGDAASDVTASKAAGTKSLVALYGYIVQQEDPYAWAADGYISNPLEILDWVAGFMR